MGCHSLLQGIFQIQESNPGLLPCRQILYRLSYEGSPKSIHLTPDAQATPWGVPTQDSPLHPSMWGMLL